MNTGYQVLWEASCNFTTIQKGVVEEIVDELGKLKKNPGFRSHCSKESLRMVMEILLSQWSTSYRQDMFFASSINRRR